MSEEQRVGATNPFIGPRPFAANDRDRFFVRDEASYELTVFTLAQRLIVVHGPSGAGKTSLLQAGVIPALAERRAAVLPLLEVDPLAAQSAAGGTPAGAYLQPYLERRLLPDAAEEDRATAPEAFAVARRQSPEFAADPFTSRVLIIDQLQELFADLSDHATGERARFVASLQQVMEDDQRLHLVLVVADSHLAEARELADAMPLATPPLLFHVGQLTHEQATEVVERTAALGGVSIDVAEVVRVAAAAGSPQEIETSTEVHQAVDTILLQTVARRAVADASTIEADDGRPPPSHLDGPLRQLFSDVVDDAAAGSTWNTRRVREWAGDTLLSPLGTRAVVPTPDDEDELAPVLAAFERGVFVERTEDAAGQPAQRLAHDRLASELVRSNRGFFARRPLILALQLGAAALAVLVVVGLSVGFFAQQELEERADDVRTARELLADARTEIDVLELRLAASDVSCAPVSAYLGDTVQCSAGHTDSVATVSWSEGGNPVGDEQPQLQLSLLELRNYVLTFEVCDVEEACAQSDEVTVEVLERLFIPAKSEVGLSGQLLLVNRSPRPTAWDAETVGWLTVVPSRGVLGGREEITLTIAQAASAPAGPSEVVLSFTAGSSDDLLLPAGSVAVSVASRPPPTLELPANFVRQETAAGAGVLVTYEVSASDVLDGQLTPECTPESGSRFFAGEHVVTCDATNSAELTTEGVFVVTVFPHVPDPPIPDPESLVACALFINGVQQEDTCKGVAIFWDGQQQPALADRYWAVVPGGREAPR